MLPHSADPCSALPRVGDVVVSVCFTPLGSAGGPTRTQLLARHPPCDGRYGLSQPSYRERQLLIQREPRITEIILQAPAPQVPAPTPAELLLDSRTGIIAMMLDTEHLPPLDICTCSYTRARTQGRARARACTYKLYTRRHTAPPRTSNTQTCASPISRMHKWPAQPAVMLANQHLGTHLPQACPPAPAAPLRSSS